MADEQQRDEQNGPEELTQEQFEALVKNANSGDESALTRLRQVLEQNPHVWQRVGDLAAHSQSALIELIAGRNQLMAESLPQVAAELKQSLTGTDPTPLEQLAAERVAVCWLQMQLCDMRAAHLDGGSRSWASFWIRAQDKAHKRYGGAIRELATIQKLLGRSHSKPPSPSSAEPASEDAQAKSASASSQETAGAEVDMPASKAESCTRPAEVGARRHGP